MLDQTLQENAYLTAAAMQAASDARLDEMIGASTMLDQSNLVLAEIVGNVKGPTAAQALADALRAQTTDLMMYSQAQTSTAAVDLDSQRTAIAVQLATGAFSEAAAENVVRRRTQQALALGGSLASHNPTMATQQLATLAGSSAELSQPLAAAMASQLPDLLPPATEGADIDVRLRLGSALLQRSYLNGATVDAAADNRVVDAQAYSAAADLAADELADQLGDMYGDDVGKSVGDSLRGQTGALVSAASGGDRRQASADIDRLRGQLDSILASANPLLAPGLLGQQLRASDQPMLTASDAFQARDFVSAYARLHEAARQSQKPAETLALAIVDRYPGRYLVLPTPGPGGTDGRGLRDTSSSRSEAGPGERSGPSLGRRVGPFGGRR
jgi:hypothetical protein